MHRINRSEVVRPVGARLRQPLMPRQRAAGRGRQPRLTVKNPESREPDLPHSLHRENDHDLVVWHEDLGFWCGGGLAAGVGGAQRDSSGCHEAEGADEQGPLESGGECLRGRGAGGQQMAGAAGRDPLNTARPSADPSWKEVVIRAAANPA